MEEKFWPAEGEEEERNSAFRTRRDLNSTSRSFSFAQFDLQKVKGKATFCKEEKLKSEKTIEQLFDKGKSVSQNGFTLVYLFTDLNAPYPAQASFSVPKRNFKHAVDRNRIKRLMREAYRTQKITLYEKLVAQKQQIAIMWVYKGKAVPELEVVVKAVGECLKKLEPTLLGKK